MFSPHVNVFSLNSEHDFIDGKVKNFKGEKGRGYRFSLISWPGTEVMKPRFDAVEPSFLGAATNFFTGVGYVINHGQPYTALAGKPPRLRIGTLVISWPMGKDGNVDRARVDAGEFEVMAWIFGYDKFKNLRDIHKDFHLGMHDIKVNCVEATYQKLDITACRESVLQRLIRDGKTDIVDKVLAQAAKTSENLEREVGREMSVEKIREILLGKQTGKTPAAAPQPPKAASTMLANDDAFADL